MRISDWSSDVCSSDLDAPDRSAGPLGGERVEPVEGLAGFRGAEAGLEQAALEGVAVADEVRVFGEVVFEQIEQDVQDALFHFPRPAPGGAVLAVSWRFRASRPCSTALRPSSSLTNRMVEAQKTVV